jgi:hypothetical protein
MDGHVNPPVRLDKKIVIVINGKGGSGKDTFCDLAAQRYRVRNISAITPIKEIAATFGWNGEKDNRARRFLSDLKAAFAAYNDLPNRYLLSEYEAFLQSEDDILFVHIREGEQIDRFRHGVHSCCITLLICSARTDSDTYGNVSDDEVEHYSYDYRYQNDTPIEQLPADVCAFLQQLLMSEHIAITPVNTV